MKKVTNGKHPNREMQNLPSHKINLLTIASKISSEVSRITISGHSLAGGLSPPYYL